jgi:hypothetical protein
MEELDGNGSAGLLPEIFGTEMTAAAGCGVPKPRHDLWRAVFLGQPVIFAPPASLVAQQQWGQ